MTHHALKEAAEAATPGPWDIRTLENFGWNVVHYRGGDRFDIERVAKTGEEANARFIALARDGVPALLADLDRVTSLLADALDEEVDGGPPNDWQTRSRALLSRIGAAR